MRRAIGIAVMALLLGGVSWFCLGGEAAQPAARPAVAEVATAVAPAPPAGDVVAERMHAVPFKDKAVASAAAPPPQSPTGTLVLCFKDNADLPVAGVSLRVIAITEGGRSDAASSTESGEVCLHLPPGEYVWAHLGSESLELKPARENAKATMGEGGFGWAVGAEASELGRKVSGPIKVQQDEVTSVQVLVHRGTMIRLEVPACDMSEARVSTLKTFLHPSGNYDHRRVEQHEIARHDHGGVLQQDMPPGDAVVEAWWRSGDQYSFAHQHRRVESGSVLDLGVLGPAATPTKSIEIKILRGATRVAFDEFFSAQTQARMLPVAFRQALELPDGADEFDCLGMIEVDKLLFLHGLPAQVRVAMLEEPPARFGLSAPEITTTAERIEIVYRLPAAKPPRLTLSFTHHDVRIYYFVLQGNKVVADGNVLGTSAELDLPAGAYSLVAHTQRATEAATPANLYLRHEFVMLAADQALTLMLQPAGRYSGVALFENKPAAKRQVFFTLPQGERDIYSVTTDAEGRFTLLGIPGELKVFGSKDRIQPGAGTITLYR